ncbi:AMP-binding protein [Streptomyces sp. NPDC056663]|uniref:AMP-binding protein n=1 Tax=Streptomyces sp. NPDC056663 TaxID=3345899 RepID=UPI0036A0FBC6
MVVELLKALGLGAALRADDRYFFHTSTSWMVWNFMVAGLMHGSTIVLYDGSPTHPDGNGVWRVAELTRASVVGVGAAYLISGEKADANPAAQLDLSALRTVLQTGSSLPPSTWRWAQDRLGPDVWLQSICGGTDICSGRPSSASAALRTHAAATRAFSACTLLQSDCDGCVIVASTISRSCGAK